MNCESAKQPTKKKQQQQRNELIKQVVNFFIILLIGLQNNVLLKDAKCISVCTIDHIDF